ncbi:response regulator [bacterium]|nr:MAG: response regulator [bacterium]
MALQPAVIVVDDEPVIAEMLSEALEKQGLRVTHCHDATQAFIQTQGLRPALLITDIMMPAWGTGVDTYKKLRAFPRFKTLPVIFLTGLKKEQAERLVPITDSRVRLLHKPVSLAVLMQTIRDLTGDRLLGPAPRA